MWFASGTGNHSLCLCLKSLLLVHVYDSPSPDESYSSSDISGYYLFEGWKVNDGWIYDRLGERCLFLPGHMRELVVQKDVGLLYVSTTLHLHLCNGGSERR